MEYSSTTKYEQIHTDHESNSSERLNTQVFIFVEDLLVASKVNKSKACVFDESLTEDRYSKLKTAFDPCFVTTLAERQKEFTEALRSQWKGTFQGSVEILTIEETLSIVKKANVQIVMSDELYFKQTQVVRSELISSTSVTIFASLFTKNESWSGIDLLVPTGRGACNILSKLKYGRIKDRTTVGLFLESTYFKPKMTWLFEDTEAISFVPAFFYEMPDIDFDVLFQRVNQYKAKMILKADKRSEKIFENYMMYEETHKDCIIIDRFDASKAMMFRSEFMEVFKGLCEVENNRQEEVIFEIPWTRGGDYLDMLEQESSDPTIHKICQAIPYPLIAKSDLACGDKFTHSFLVIEEEPEDPKKLKEHILKEYCGRAFILQSFIKDDTNVVIKAMYFMGEFTYDLREGLNNSASHASSGEFIEQSRQSLIKNKGEQKSEDAAIHKEEALPEGSITDFECEMNSEFISVIKSFTGDLAEKMGLHMLGIDFVVDTTSRPFKVLPIDLNKMPRPDNIPGFREKLVNLCKEISNKEIH